MPIAPPLFSGVYNAPLIVGNVTNGSLTTQIIMDQNISQFVNNTVNTAVNQSVNLTQQVTQGFDVVTLMFGGVAILIVLGLIIGIIYMIMQALSNG